MSIRYKLGISVNYKYLLNERKSVPFNIRYKNNFNYFYGSSKYVKPS